MAGGDYHNQLYQDYQAFLTENESLIVRLKRQAKQLAEEAKRMKKLEEKLAIQTAKTEELTAEIIALKKEVLRLNGLAQTNGSNSGLPTSQTRIQQTKRIPNTRQLSGKQKGGQPGHTKVSLKPFKDQEVTIRETLDLDCCPKCQGALVETGDKRTKDELDYQVLIVKKRHEFPGYQCLVCGKKVRAMIPPQLKEPNQYGARVQALALSFMNEANVSINKTKQMIDGFTFNSIRPSEGYLAKLQRRAANHLTDFNEELRQILLKRHLVYWDDTVIMIDTKRCCLRFYGDDQLALYKAHRHKNLEGIKNDRLLTLLGPETTVMHDHNKVNYNECFSYSNIECNVHLLRDLRKCTDNTGHEWAGELDGLLTSMNTRRNVLIDTGETDFPFSEVMSFYAELDLKLVKGMEENQQDTSHYYSQTERALINRLIKYRQYYFAWVVNFELPFSNNLAERGLRGVKSKLKVAGQFQHLESANCYAMIKSYMETSYRHGINGIDALNQLMAGNPYTVAELIGNERAKSN